MIERRVLSLFLRWVFSAFRGNHLLYESSVIGDFSLLIIADSRIPKRTMMAIDGYFSFWEMIQGVNNIPVIRSHQIHTTKADKPNIYLRNEKNMTPIRRTSGT